jgi:hypothetical protein
MMNSDKHKKPPMSMATTKATFSAYNGGGEDDVRSRYSTKRESFEFDNRTVHPEYPPPRDR